MVAYKEHQQRCQHIFTKIVINLKKCGEICKISTKYYESEVKRCEIIQSNIRYLF